MNSVAVVIPTYRRIEKLTRCLNSIAVSNTPNVQIFVYCDNGDTDTEIFLNGYNKIMKLDLKVRVNPRKMLVIGSWNRFAYEGQSYDWKYLMWLVDDAEIRPDTIRKAVECMCFNYPDTDGVVGLTQVCPGYPNYTYKPYGQVLIGRKFVDRYATVDYQVSCPYYDFMYQDEEMWLHAKSLGKFIHSKEATINHYHPAFIKTEMDDTHDISRQNLAKDRKTYTQRQAKGLVWGLTWENV